MQVSDRLVEYYLEAKKYTLYFYIGLLTIAGVLAYVLLLKGKSGTLEKINDIVDKTSEKISDIEIQKKETEIVSEVERKYIKKEKKQKLQELNDLKDIEDRNERMKRLTELYKKIK